MTVLNITLAGESRDFDLALPLDVTDDDIRRIAVELMQGALGDPGEALVRRDTFSTFVVDRIAANDRIYLRPKVPFGGVAH